MNQHIEGTDITTRVLPMHQSNNCVCMFIDYNNSWCFYINKMYLDILTINKIPRYIIFVIKYKQHFVFITNIFLQMHSSGFNLF